MTDINTSNGAGKRSSKFPSHLAYQVRDRKGKAGFWTRIGAAFNHGDGQGFTIQLESIPVDGRITLRVVQEK